MLCSTWFATAFSVTLLILPAPTADLNDCPTVVRADFIFACMKANGATRDALERCSCAIDVIATILRYGALVRGEMVASLSLEHGQIGNMMRSTAISKVALGGPHRARAEAEVCCF